MGNEKLMQDFYERLLKINKEAFAAREFNVAFHALAAALHCAKQLKSQMRLKKVEEAARAQLEWIDRNAPNYEHSSESARLRGHSSIFATLAVEAGVRVDMVNGVKRGSEPKGM